MKLSFSTAATVALLWTRSAQAACSANLLVDNYANFANSLNSLGLYTSGRALSRNRDV